MTGKGSFKDVGIHEDIKKKRKLRIKLQDARVLSYLLHQLKEGDAKPKREEGSYLKRSHLLMAFGQFLDHELVLSPEPGNKHDEE